MEIRKIVFILIVGCLVCSLFVGMWKLGGNHRSEKEESRVEGVKQETPLPQATEKVPLMQEGIGTAKTTEAPLVQETIAPQKPTKEPVVQETKAPQKPTKEPVVQETKAPQKPTKEPVVQETKAPQKPTEVPPIQVTQVPVKPTDAPTVTQAPIPQNTMSPPTTNAPVVEEEVHIHEFEKAVWELPSCKKGGYYNNVCKICGFVECVSQEPLPHEKEDVLIQEGNCMEDRVIRHICKNCGIPVESDTRYPLYDVHDWEEEEIDGVLVEYCVRCGVVK